MNIYQRIAAVMKAVSYVKKDKTVSGSGGGYRAVTHDMVTAMVRPHLVEHGIVVVPRLVNAQTVSTGRSTSGGTPINRFEGQYVVAFVNVDDPKDCIEVPAAAHAEDHGDKAPGKALSYATKYAILKVLLLETGEDDEGRIGPAEQDMTEAQEAVLATLRERALEGTAALKAAWKDLGAKVRDELRAHLDSLKAAAAEADKGGSRAA